MKAKCFLFLFCLFLLLLQSVWVSQPQQVKTEQVYYHLGELRVQGSHAAKTSGLAFRRGLEKEGIQPLLCLEGKKTPGNPAKITESDI